MLRMGWGRPSRAFAIIRCRPGPCRSIPTEDRGRPRFDGESAGNVGPDERPGKADMKPLVFVAMPFGLKWDVTHSFQIDFDHVYERGIKPAVDLEELEVIRADEEQGGGVIHLPMFERLLLAEIAIVDVTNQNANVFYELGIRHAARPRSTIIVAANEKRRPLDSA